MIADPGHRVLIAGTGVAAAVLACLLRDDGFQSLMQRHLHRSPGRPVLEAVPEPTVRLLADAGIGSRLAGAGVAVRGFRGGTGEADRLLDGWWIHADRHLLAARCLAAARDRPAADRFREIRRLRADATTRESPTSPPAARACSPTAAT